MNSKKVDVLIIEDNDDTAQIISKSVTNHSGLRLRGRAKNKKDAIEIINEVKPELILMDIELGDSTAFDILDGFHYRDFQVIFVTGHSHYIQKAFEYYAFYFLNKPFDESKFNEVIQHFILQRQSLFDKYKWNFLRDFLQRKDNPQFLLHTGTDYLAINLDDVVVCKSDGNYTSFYFLDGQKVLASFSLKYYDELLSERGFFRASRFDLVNSKNIKKIIRKETILMVDNQKINVSLRNRERLTRFIDSFK